MLPPPTKPPTTLHDQLIELCNNIYLVRDKLTEYTIFINRATQYPITDLKLYFESISEYYQQYRTALTYLREDIQRIYGDEETRDPEGHLLYLAFLPLEFHMFYETQAPITRVINITMSVSRQRKKFVYLSKIRYLRPQRLFRQHFRRYQGYFQESAYYTNDQPGGFRFRYPTITRSNSIYQLHDVRDHLILARVLAKYKLFYFAGPLLYYVTSHYVTTLLINFFNPDVVTILKNLCDFFFLFLFTSFSFCFVWQGEEQASFPIEVYLENLELCVLPFSLNFRILFV